MSDIASALIQALSAIDADLMVRTVRGRLLSVTLNKQAYDALAMSLEKGRYIKTADDAYAGGLMRLYTACGEITILRETPLTLPSAPNQPAEHCPVNNGPLAPMDAPMREALKSYKEEPFRINRAEVAAIFGEHCPRSTPALCTTCGHGWEDCPSCKAPLTVGSKE